ncbi:MAG: hypothetical protein ACKO8L_08725, partial [Flavobacterium sp.]
ATCLIIGTSIATVTEHHQRCVKSFFIYFIIYYDNGKLSTFLTLFNNNRVNTNHNALNIQ